MSLLVKHLLAEIQSLPYHRLNQTNVSEIRLAPNGDLFLVTSDEEVEVLKGNIKDNEKVIEALEKDNEDLSERYDDLEKELFELRETVSGIQDSELSLRDLVEQNDNQAKQIEQYRQAHQSWMEYANKKEKEVEKLRARKNKATVSRSVHTGKLIAEFNGRKYYLESEISEEKP